jgi:Na+/proline symporter
MTGQIVIAFVIYALALVGINYFFARRAASAKSFSLGNRSTNYWVTAIALQVSDMSHWLFMGLPLSVYTFGLITFWECVGLVSFMFLSWHFIATKIRVETEKYNSNTIFSYFEKKFNDNSGSIRLLSSVISTVFLTFYISSGILALARVFEQVFGLSYFYGVILGFFIAISYTLIGGFLAVAWCDFFQGIYVFFMIILVPTVAFFCHWRHRRNLSGCSVKRGFSKYFSCNVINFVYIINIG